MKRSREVPSLSPCTTHPFTSHLVLLSFSSTFKQGWDNQFSIRFVLSSILSNLVFQMEAQELLITRLVLGTLLIFNNKRILCLFAYTGDKQAVISTQSRQERLKHLLKQCFKKGSVFLNVLRQTKVNDAFHFTLLKLTRTFSKHESTVFLLTALQCICLFRLGSL